MHIFLMTFLLPLKALSLEPAVDQFCGDLAIAQQRLDIATSNFANVETTRTTTGGPYKKKATR